MSSKKCKLSSLSGLELWLAYNTLLKLKESIVYEESEGGEEGPAPEHLKGRVDAMLALLRSKLEGPQSLTFSNMTMEDLNITFTGFIDLKPKLEGHIAASTWAKRALVFGKPILSVTIVGKSRP
ncbi:hypothetical protein APHAL10511_008534 [Amanita phalloides]|nr:hypothetical protein APHAL10511_008534 [Amanita phalloides]